MPMVLFHQQALKTEPHPSGLLTKEEERRWRASQDVTKNGGETLGLQDRKNTAESLPLKVPGTVMWVRAVPCLVTHLPQIARNFVGPRAQGHCVLTPGAFPLGA